MIGKRWLVMKIIYLKCVANKIGRGAFLRERKRNQELEKEILIARKTNQELRKKNETVIKQLEILKALMKNPVRLQSVLRRIEERREEI